jgi:hypothetical protein
MLMEVFVNSSIVGDTKHFCAVYEEVLAGESLYVTHTQPGTSTSDAKGQKYLGKR